MKINFNIPVSIDEGLLPDHGSSTYANHPPDGGNTLNLQSRLFLSDKQWRVIGNIQNGPKPVMKQTRFFACAKHILNRFIIESNGGVVPAEINQKKLRLEIVDKKKLNQNTISLVIKFLLDNKFLRVDHQFVKGKNSKFYVGDIELLTLLDPKEKRKVERTTKLESLRKSYLKKGFTNPRAIKECFMCKCYKELIHFSIKSTDKSTTHPVCGECYKENYIAANKACRAFYTMDGIELLYESYDEMIADRIARGLPVVAAAAAILPKQYNAIASFDDSDSKTLTSYGSTNGKSNVETLGNYDINLCPVFERGYKENQTNQEVGRSENREDGQFTGHTFRTHFNDIDAQILAELTEGL